MPVFLQFNPLKVPKDVYYCHLRIMHDEVSETENIRKNLAIERMIVEGCEVLLDTSQTFVRQGEARGTARPHTEGFRVLLIYAGDQGCVMEAYLKACVCVCVCVQAPSSRCP